MNLDPFEMASLLPKHTGLPFVVWICCPMGVRHDVCVKVSPGIRDEMASVAIHPDIRVVEGSIPPEEFELLCSWIRQNRETLIAHWEGEIDTPDAMKALVSL